MLLLWWALMLLLEWLVQPIASLSLPFCHSASVFHCDGTSRVNITVMGLPCNALAIMYAYTKLALKTNKKLCVNLMNWNCVHTVRLHDCNFSFQHWNCPFFVLYCVQLHLARKRSISSVSSFYGACYLILFLALAMSRHISHKSQTILSLSISVTPVYSILLSDHALHVRRFACVSSGTAALLLEVRSAGMCSLKNWAA